MTSTSHALTSHCTPTPGHPKFSPPSNRLSQEGVWGHLGQGQWVECGREEVLEAVGVSAQPCRTSLQQLLRPGPRGGSGETVLLSLLQTVPHAHRDNSPQVTTRPASPGPSE